jgi:hypothetical protein
MLVILGGVHTSGELSTVTSSGTFGMKITPRPGRTMTVGWKPKLANGETLLLRGPAGATSTLRVIERLVGGVPGVWGWRSSVVASTV